MSRSRTWIMLAALALMAATVSLAAEPPAIASAGETDQWLQSQGRGWGLGRAEIKDPATGPALPRVLLIGDSSLGGYRDAVVKALESKAHADACTTSHWHSPQTNEILADVLAHGPCDVVHFNMGLHGVMGRPAELDPVINGTIIEHNRMAASVMQETNVSVNDLYGVLVDRRDLALGNGFHWKPVAHDLLAREVAAAVGAADDTRKFKDDYGRTRR